MKKVSVVDSIIRNIVTLSFAGYLLYLTLLVAVLFLAREVTLSVSRPVIKKEVVQTQAVVSSSDQLVVSVADEEADDVDLEKTNPAQAAKRDNLLKLLNEGDPSSVFLVVDTIEGDPSLIHNCHEIAHDIGHAAYKLYGFQGAMNFTDVHRTGHATVQEVCAGGYVHGVLEAASRKDKNFLAHPSVLCETVPSKSKDSCFHGVGHALMFLHKRNVEESLASCRLIGNTFFNSRCFEGVWMELFRKGREVTPDKDATGFDKENPFLLCEETLQDAKRACYLYAVFGYLYFHPKDYQSAIRECTKASFSLDESEFCLKGVGIAMNSYFKEGDFENTESYVSGLLYGQRYAFYQGVFGYAQFSGRNKENLLDVCGKMKGDSALCKDVLSSRY